MNAVGCITVYHPLSGLQNPVVVDPTLANLTDVRILVHCVPLDLLEGEAGLLYQRVKQLFENQGADVRTITSVGRTGEEEGFEDRAESAEPPAEGVEKKKPERIDADLTVEIRARNIHERTDYAMWILSYFTFTLAPGISENSFLQEVVIRDARGSLLYTGELKGRIVRYFGLGYWASNKILNFIARDDDEDLNDDQLSASLSRDMYGQLSQMVFNANMRRRVLTPTRRIGGES